MFYVLLDYVNFVQEQKRKAAVKCFVCLSIRSIFLVFLSLLTRNTGIGNFKVRFQCCFCREFHHSSNS